MIQNAIFHRTRPYNEEEIYLAIMAYLENNFIFRRLEIDKWLDDDRIIYIRKILTVQVC